MKVVLWKVAKCLSYIQDARCLKVKCLSNFQGSLAISWMTELLVPVCLNMLKRSLFPTTKEDDRISLYALSREKMVS